MSNATITIIGHVGKPPKLQELDNGSKKASFRVAVNGYRKKDADTDPEPTWYQVETWNGGCDRVMDLITGGREVVVNGSLSINTFRYEEEGIKKERQIPVVKMQSFHLCGKKPEAKDEAKFAMEEEVTADQ